jgi:pyrophosphatase PpaX
MKITTVLFDLDGTLINTNELIIKSFLQTLDTYYPGKYSRNDVLPFIGPPLEESFGTIDETRIEELVKYYREFNIKHHDDLVEEFEGVKETVKILKEKGFKLGVVTSKIRQTVNMGLNITQLSSYFDVVITVDDVQKPKPDPEPILFALEKLDSKPEETIMIGDIHYDILAGKNAGTKTAGVAWTLRGKDYLSSYNPDFMLDTMTDLLEIVGAK